jgi:hypothetical protein
MSDDFYQVFASWAKAHGVEAAEARFTSGVGGAKAAEYAAFYREQSAKIQFGGPPILRAGGEPWYVGPTEDAKFWPPLLEAMQGGTLGNDAVLSVDKSSSLVVAHTPPPRRREFAAKGLVVGYVQSGKTTNFTSVVAKMADEGYRFVIVLAGIHNGLRKQTQLRLQSQLQEPLPENWHLLTTENFDFRVPPNPPAATFSDDRVVLAVVKKNPAVLEKLVTWLDTEAGRRTLREVRVLIVDDEADQASVATPRINPLIMRLLALAPRHTYVGYTATPFANVFINPAAEDLYPSDFILNLPRPEGYFGPEAIFGSDVVAGEEGSDDGHDMVRIVDDADVGKFRPVSKAAAPGFVPTITDQLRDAVRWFWLASAARRARGELNAHSTMLIHTAIPIAVHEAFREPLEYLRDQTVRDLEDSEAAIHHELRTQWADETGKVPAGEWGRRGTDFDELLPHIANVVSATRIILDNHKSEERLVYNDDEPLVAIAVGGNTLSRGLTLEGLVVSFFVRAARAYDTLMQMGRWFGFRRGYEDLPRIWMTEELLGQFRHLVTVEREMREDIEHYQRQDLTPREAAVRIRTHPALQITAKMGAAQPSYVSFAGRRLQTRYFRHKDRDWLVSNVVAADRLVASLGEPSEFKGSAALFRDVPMHRVREFLLDYHVHPDSPDLDATLMLKYMAEAAAADVPSLATWTVAMVTADGPEIELGGRGWASVTRSRLKGGDERGDIKTLMSKPDRVLDLQITSADAAKISEQDLMVERSRDPIHADRGLLVLYPIDPASQPETERAERFREGFDALAPVIGLGIVFPGAAEEGRRVRAEKMAVDLSGVMTPEEEEALEEDTEGIE